MLPVCGKVGRGRLQLHHALPYMYVLGCIARIDVGVIVHVKTLLHVHYREEMIPLGDGDIRTMCPFVSMKPGEYSYFSPRTMSMWAGPDHWRFRPRHKRMYFQLKPLRERDSGRGQQSAGQPRKGNARCCPVEPPGQLQAHIDQPASQLAGQSVGPPGMRAQLRLRPLSGKSQESWAPDLVLPCSIHVASNNGCRWE